MSQDRDARRAICYVVDISPQAYYADAAPFTTRQERRYPYPTMIVMRA